MLESPRRASPGNLETEGAIMKRTLMAAAAALLAAPVWAQMGPGMGPGMMGPGMMGGYGMGPGTMEGYGYGPGMMGLGAMGGYGMGPGMMGPGTMGPGYGAFGGLGLSDEQRARIAEIQHEVSRKQWDLMGKMHEQRYQMHQFDAQGKLDDGAARKAYQAMGEAHKAMFETMLDARKRIDSVLTKEQREQLRRGWWGGR
jgi:Spy/CpxP family protein refolding chaperone